MANSHSFIRRDHTPPDLVKRAPVTKRIDDRDSLITYSGTWRLLGNVTEYLRTTHGTSTAGSKATFQFTGTGVRVVGTMGKTTTRGRTLTTYVLDNGANIEVLNPVVPNLPLYLRNFFQASALPNRQHTLTITYNRGSSFYLDYIEVTSDSDPPPSTSATSQVPPTTEATTSSELASTSSSDTHPPPAPPATSDPPAETSNSAIAQSHPTSSSSGPTSSSSNFPSIAATLSSAEHSEVAGETQAPKNSTGEDGGTRKAVVSPGMIVGVIAGVVVVFAIACLLRIRGRRGSRSRKTEAQLLQPVHFVSARHYGQDGATSQGYPFSSSSIPQSAPAYDYQQGYFTVLVDRKQRFDGSLTASPASASTALPPNTPEVVNGFEPSPSTIGGQTVDDGDSPPEYLSHYRNTRVS